MQQLPNTFLERLRKVLPQHNINQYLDIFHHPFHSTFWVNSLKACTEEIIEALQPTFTLESYTWHPQAFVISDKQKRALTETNAYQQGKIYILNASSLLPPLVLNPQPGEEILDLTAAPGGKTIQLAATMQNQGRIAAVEVVKERFFRLKANLKRYGVNIVQPYLKDGCKVGEACPERFDRVLLDAPCSSEARFKIYDEKTYAYWSERKIKEMKSKKIALLTSGLTALKPGGTLVYCTCSFEIEENETIVERALEKFANIHIENFHLPIDNIQGGLTIKVKAAKRILPTEQFEGFFICKIKKSL